VRGTRRGRLPFRRGRARRNSVFLARFAPRSCSAYETPFSPLPSSLRFSPPPLPQRLSRRARWLNRAGGLSAGIVSLTADGNSSGSSARFRTILPYIDTRKHIHGHTHTGRALALTIVAPACSPTTAMTRAQRSCEIPFPRDANPRASRDGDRSTAVRHRHRATRRRWRDPRFY